MTNAISKTLKLACGLQVKNRLLKSAMSEQLGDKNHNPGIELPRLYGVWADGGIVIAVSGNVMIDRSALGEPRNVVLDEKSDLELFKAWAEAGRANDTQIWMQLNHPGKQIPNFLSKEPVAPSAVPLEMGMDSVFNMPRELTEAEILEIIAKFATSAGLAQKAGFSGVQIHCAHGYLLSQFLSPWHNRREDDWGGSLENRMRMLVEVYRAMRKEVGDAFPIGLKINSSDYKDGGFTFDDSRLVAVTMQNEGLDLIEISGGTYENPSMTGLGMGSGKDGKEAYFVEFAKTISSELTMPLVVTGGFRSGSAMNAALESGATDMIGLARPLAVYPDLPNKLMEDNDHETTLKRPSTGIRMVDRMAMLDITWYEYQLYRIGRGKKINLNQNSWSVVAQMFWRMGSHAFSRRRARSA